MLISHTTSRALRSNGRTTWRLIALTPLALAFTYKSIGTWTAGRHSTSNQSTSRASQLYSFLRPYRLAPSKFTRSASTMETISSLPPSELGNYEVLADFHLDYAPVNVLKIRSKKTGFSVVVGQAKTPITNCYFIVRTEIFNDSGCPHTLEHLVFLGSEQYPYKGVLDSLANRAGGDGTNAWTADDHTAYTLSTAGSEGILNMLPIYLDHILYPTITKAGSVTEVYHVNGKGEDAGVVMSEMQGVENQSSQVVGTRLQLAMYPDGSAYRSETGGMQAALRKLTVEEIRDFHTSAYQPHNICLHLDGSIPLGKLLHILNNEIDPLILAHQQPIPSIPPPGFKRPFLETPSAPGPVIQKNVVEVVPFMEKDESVGEVTIGWRGPKNGAFLEELAFDVLTTYLTDSEIAPLAKEFIEISTPACTSIDFYCEGRASAAELTCGISGVPYAKLTTIAGEVTAFLSKLADKEDLDMVRLSSVIRRDRRKLLALAESSVTNVLTDAIVSDFLYSDADAKDLKRSFDDLKWYDELLTWSASDWIQLLKRYLLDNPSVTIIGKPSAELADTIVSEDKARVQARKAELGEEGLSKKAKELEKAQEENDRPIPDNMITDFPISDATKIDWIPVESAVNPVASVGNASPRVQAHVDADGDRLPYFVHFSHIESNFIVVRAVIDTTGVPAELKPYLKLYHSTFFGLGVLRPEGMLNHEDVVQQLTELTVSYDIGLGIRGDYPELMEVSFKVEKDSYEKSIAWLRDLLSKSVFSVERLQITLAKLIQELPERKRSGSRIASSTASSLVFDRSKSASQAIGLLASIEFLPEMEAELKAQPEQVVQKLESLRKYLLEPTALRVSVAANVMSIPNPRSAWAKNFLAMKEFPTGPVPNSRDTMTDLGVNPATKAVVVSMGSIEGSYASIYGKGPLGWEHKDLAALKLSAGVLDAFESYFWKRIRGAGLAYSTSVDVEEEYGLLCFRVYRSPEAAKAIKAAADCLEGLVDGSIELDENIVNAAKSTMAYSLARQEASVGTAASTVFLNEALKNLPGDQGARFLRSLQDVSLEQVRDAFKTWWLPLFSAKTSVVAVAAAPALADKITESLTSAGYEVERRELVGAPGGEDSDFDGSMSGDEEHSDGEEGSDRSATQSS